MPKSTSKINSDDEGGTPSTATKSPRKISFSLDQLPPIKITHPGKMPTKTLLKAVPFDGNEPTQQNKLSKINKIHTTKASSIPKPANPFSINGTAVHVVPQSTGHSRHTHDHKNVTEDRVSKSAMARMTKTAKCSTSCDDRTLIDIDEYIDTPCPWCQQGKTWNYRPLSYKEESIIERSCRQTISSRIHSAPFSTANKNLKRQNSRSFIKTLVFTDGLGGKTQYAKPKAWLPHSIWKWGPGF